MLGEAENRVLRRLFIDYGEDIDTKGLITFLEIKGVITEEKADSISCNDVRIKRSKIKFNFEYCRNYRIERNRII